jgi:P-type conjugative transfer protein TrbL
MKKWFLFLFLFLSFIPPVFAGSMSYPLDGEPVVTSPFGWRVHPIFGTEIFHSGIDFAADYDQEVHATADGVVDYAGWISGYGYAVVIDHGNGLQTLYGHNESLLAFTGATVSQGTVIAYAGSTGNSTGPHVHFEVDLNGEPVDPASYLDGNLPVSDGSFSNFFQSDYNFIPINFDASVDFAKPMRDTATAFGEKCTAGLTLIKDQVKWLFVALMTIDFAIAALWTFCFKDDVPITHWLIKKLLFYGFLLFMITHWGDWVANNILSLSTSMGGMVTGSTAEEAGKIISDPTMIVQKGAAIVGPIFTYVGTFSGPSILLNFGMVSISLILATVILLCFVLIGIQILLSYIEFYVIALFSFVTFSFSGLTHTRRFGGDGLNALVAVSIKLMFFCIFSALLTTTLQSLTIDDYFNTGSIKSSQNDKDLSSASNATSIDQFMEAIKQVESGGDYYLPSNDGYGYGAYQISYANWNNWCVEAGISVPAEWTPENQDTVARCVMLEYYQEYGNWHDVAVAWNGGGGAVGRGWSSTEEYAQKVEAALGHPIQKTLNIILLFAILVMTLLFLLFAGRVSKTIMQLFGGSGFYFERGDGPYI